MPTIRGLRYRLSALLHTTAAKLFVLPGGNSFRDIGLGSLPATAPRALIVYVAHIMPYYLSGRLAQAPMLAEHPMYWETAEMVRQLNERGYVVDYYDINCAAAINWKQYAVAFVQNDRLEECPPWAAVKKVFYCTENYWAFQNAAELTRLRAFHERTGIWVKPERQTPVRFSDEHAEVITSFGTDFQRQFYSTRPHRHQLNISVVHQPTYAAKDVSRTRRNFIWMGSNGTILKGIDLVVEAFIQMPEATLYLAGNLEREPRIWQWIKPLLRQYPNLRYQGWMDVTSAKFAQLAHSCIGQVYPSASEGGPGSVAQLLHFGLLPIVTRSAAVRSAHLGFEIDSEDPTVIINQLVAHTRAVSSMTDAELAQRSAACQAFAQQVHTRPAYAASFAELLDQLAL